MPPKNTWRLPFLFIFIIEILLFFTGFFFNKSIPDGLLVFIFHVCGAWYIGLIYVTIMLIALEVVKMSNRIRKWYPAWIIKKYAQVKLCTFFLIIITVAGILTNGYFSVMRPEVKHLYINLAKKSAMGRDSLTVMMMSDIHIGEIITKKQVKRIVETANSHNPDIILLAGDIVDYDLHSAMKHNIDKELMKLKAPLGVFAVNGNHEYRANRFSKRKWIRNCGITLMTDSAALIDNTFYLVGRDDYINKKRQPIHALISNLDKEKTLIMMDHQPRSIVEASMNGIDFTFCGHTHNGQYWPYSQIMRLVYKCAYGYYRRGKSQYYVSSGAGVAGPPYRVGTLSEMVVAHIRFN
jgi:predicted MPP superfamily phosphohydrolase